MGAAISFFTKTVAAGVDRAEIINVTGSLFLCKESSDQFSMQFDDGAKFPVEGGFSLRPPGGFRRVTLFNQNAADDLTVAFYAGDTFVSYDYLKTPKTRLVAFAQSLSSGQSFTRLGINGGDRRKQIIVTNAQASESVQIIDVDSGVAMATVFAARTLAIETDADVKIKNPSSADPIPVQVAEIFYTS